MGPLAGIKVLDLSRVLAGPWASQCLADFGADVIKIEKPGVGDDTRAWGPPWFEKESAYFLSANRGKQSVAIDISHPLGADLVRRLAGTSDIVLENFKVGGLAQYGLDYPSLSALNSGLIYCSISGFGQTGPMAHLPGYDAMIQAQGGLMSVTGIADGEPGAGPQKTGVAIADLLAGMYSLSAVLAALHHREKTGRGQHIDISLLDTQVASLANQAMNFLVSNNSPKRLGNSHPNIVPYQSFPTKNGALMLAVGNDRQFASFCDAVGHAEFTTEPRFARNTDRVANRAELLCLCESWLKTQDTELWLARFGEAGVPCGPINSIQQAFEHPQIKAREMQFSLPHACGLDVPQVRSPVRFSETPIEYKSAPPALAQHTMQVLRTELAVTDAEIAQLIAAGAITVA
jgi:crotonobetainyl-CoA:carnitine CoA-transferase CaiB-like acyl-CoA transferase